MVLVPKFRAKATDITGVAGQPFGFKAPAGALSVAEVATAKASEQFAGEAAQWGVVAMRLHRNLVVSDSTAAANKAIDGALAEAQRKRISGVGEDSILGHFEQAGKEILQSAMSSTWDPLARAAIRLDVSGYISGQRRVLQRFYAGRLVDEGKAALNRDTRDALQEMALQLPSDWGGDEEDLPAAVRDLLAQTEAKYNAAAEINLVTKVEAGKTIADLRGDVAWHAVGLRNNAAQTSDQVDQLMGLLDDPTNFLWLRSEDRLRLQSSLLSKHSQLLGRELREDDALRVRRARELKVRQAKNLSGLIVRIFRAREGEMDDDGDLIVMPTEREIVAIAKLDGGLGLKSGNVTMLINMIDAKGPNDSEPEFMADLYATVIAIVNDQGLSQNERKDEIAIQIERAGAQIAKRFQSALTHQDYITFVKWADTAANNQVRSGEVQDYLNLVRQNAAPHDGLNLKDQSNVFKVLEAMDQYWRGIGRGLTPLEAAKQALRRVGVTMGDDGAVTGAEPFFPENLPYTFSITTPGSPPAFGKKKQTVTMQISEIDVAMPGQVDYWTLDHVANAQNWAKANAGTLGKQKFKDLLDELKKIEVYVRSK